MKRAPAPPRCASSDVALPVLAGSPRPVQKSSSGRRRAIVLIVVQMLMIAHVVQWKITGTTVSPIEPSESMELVKRGVINAGLVFFAVALLSTVLLGRWFCGWGCHLVMLQDFCSWLLRKAGIHPRPFRSRLLLYVPFLLALYMFVWPAVYRWGIVPLSQTLHQAWGVIPALPSVDWPGLSLELTTDDFWHTFASWAVAIPFLLVCGFATVYFLGNKGFCTYGCPYGGFFAPLDSFSRGRIRVTDACEHCGHCTAVCTSNVRVHEEVRTYGMVVDQGCMKCLDCVSVCPNDALYFGFGPAASSAKPRAEVRTRRPDLSWPEEIGLAVVFLVSFFAVRGVYGLVPMLMAVGIAICVTFISWKLWRMLRAPSVSFRRFRLRYKGRVTRAGTVFAALGLLLLGVVVHSGLVRVTMARADDADGLVMMPRQFVFSYNAMQLPPEQEAAADRAIALYERAGWIGDGGIGLFPSAAVDERLAWLHATKQDLDAALAMLERRTRRFGETEGVCRDVAILLRLLYREDEAGAYYRDIVRRHVRWVHAFDDFVMWEVTQGRIDEAIDLCRTRLAEPRLSDEQRLFVMRRLSLLLLEYGNLEEGIALIRRTIEIDPDNPAARRQLAAGLLKHGRVDEAVEAMEQALERFPDDPSLHEGWADLLDALGRGAEAADARARAARLRSP